MSQLSPEESGSVKITERLERRAALEIRAAAGVIFGHCIVFDSRSADLGGFVEIVRPSAVQRALQPAADVVGLFNHDSSAILGRTPTTLQLRTDDTGLAFDLHPPATQAGREALELVGRGDIRGASFGFRTIADAWHRDGPVTIRELLDIEIAEISLTAFPAYAATDATLAQRSFQQFRSAVWRPTVQQLRRQQRIGWLRRRG